MPCRTLERLSASLAPADGPDDAELLARFTHDRDEGAFAHLVRRHARLVLRVCRGVLRDRHAAEDCAQATFLALARQTPSITRGTVAGWLFRVARRTAVRAARRRQPTTGLDSEAADLAAPPGVEALPRETEAVLHEELARLPEHYRVPVLLCFFDGLSHAAAARHLGCPVGTVNTRIARAKRLLARRLAGRGVRGEALGVVAVPAAFVGSTAGAAVALAAGRVPGVPVEVVELANYGGGHMVRDKLARVAWVLAAGGGLVLGAAVAPAQRPGAAPPSPATAPAPAPRPTPAQVRDGAVKAIAANYARLKTVTATVEQVALDPSVTEERTTVQRTPGGGEATWIQRPRFVRTLSLTLRGEEMRCSAAPDGEVWAFGGGVWTRYSPELKTLSKLRPDQTPGMFPFDPREAGSTEFRERFLDRLRADELVRAETLDTPAGRRVVVVTKAAGVEPVRHEFDPARNHLPTRVEYPHPDGGVNVVVDVTYREAVKGEAWFPAEVTNTMYGKAGAKAGDPGWTGRLSLTVKELRVNAPLPADAFHVAAPPGTFVSDLTTVPRTK
ncbi:RNA polymerase sigma factor [bacterium]|nr:RNA polymerase sigma factor [bacterium]